MTTKTNDPAKRRLLVRDAPGALPDVLDRDERATSLSAILQSKRLAVLVVVLAFALSAAYAFAHLKVGWVPGDDGLLAESARRVLQGQVPHRDFAEVYTGGLSYIHAAAFRIFGTNLGALRLSAFLCFLAWLPAVFYVASRFTSAVPAAGITVLAAVWSLPTYPAAMPSWYNLFFAVFGMAALLRYIEVGGRRWLFLAGVLGGASILIKVIGLYYVAAALLFFAFREQELTENNPAVHSAENGASPRNSRFVHAYRGFAAVSLATFLAVLLLVMRHRFDDREFVHFFLPSAILVFLLVRREGRISKSTGRFATLFKMVLPFLGGVLLPLVLFLVAYRISGSQGAFSDAMGQMESNVAGLGVIRPPGAQLLLYAIPAIALMAAAALWNGVAGTLRGLVAGFALAILLVTTKCDPNVAGLVWRSTIVLTPIAVVLGAAVLLARPRFADALANLRAQQLMLVLAMAAVCSLVQFPFSAPIYFCYCAPLTALALFALLSIRKRPASPLILASVLGFYVLFAVVVVTPNRIFQRWKFMPNPPPVESLKLPRAGGLRVEAAALFETVTALVQEHGTNGLLIATPECPELYFLSGLRNPTGNDSVVGVADLVRTAQRNDVNVIVLNERAFFGRESMTANTTEEIAREFPHSTAVGRYRVYWRREGRMR